MCVRRPQCIAPAALSVWTPVGRASLCLDYTLDSLAIIAMNAVWCLNVEFGV